MPPTLPDTTPLTGTTSSTGRRFAALVLLCFASFMMILDSEIVILALPSIQNALGLDPSAAQWILTANAITFGGLLLLGGRMADLLGRRRVFMWGMALFLITSLVSGIAWSGEVIIAARALHGVSSAMLVPSALSILMNTFREGKERNRAIASWSAVGGIGATAGLLLGGTITTGLGWQWVFLVNVPVVALVMLISPFVLDESWDRNRVRNFDIAGAVTITVAATALVYAISNGPELGWGSAPIIGLIATVILLLGAFVVIEARSAAPLVPLRFLRLHTVASGNLLMVVVAMIVWGASVLISLYTQQVLGYSAVMSGFATSVMPVAAVFGAYIGQAFITKRGFRVVAGIGLLGLGVGCLLLSRIPVEGQYFRDLFVALGLFGLSLGVGHTTASIVALTAVPEPESGLASGLSAASFQVGGAIGVAFVMTVSVTVSGGSAALPDLTRGFQAAFIALVCVAIVGFVIALALPRKSVAQAG